MSELTLRPITRENLRAVCDLDVRPEQRDSVAPNAFSIAQAYVEDRAWPRAIYLGETPIGFVMLHLDRHAPDGPVVFLWRFMIDARHQRRGYGRAALDLVVSHVRGFPGASELRSSYVDGEAGPGGFYRAYGFRETGEHEHDKVVIALSL
jgi:diamine N-acetyltransferase